MEGIALCVGVGAIPSVEPKTEAEKMVYATLDALLVHPYAASSTHQSRKEVVARDYLPLPRKPCYLDMAYKVCAHPLAPMSFSYDGNLRRR